jgi:hypothetical protein
MYIYIYINHPFTKFNIKAKNHYDRYDDNILVASIVRGNFTRKL